MTIYIIKLINIHNSVDIQQFKAKQQQTYTFTRFKMINMYDEQSYLQNEEWHFFNTKRYNIDTTLYINLRILVLLIFL